MNLPEIDDITLTIRLSEELGWTAEAKCGEHEGNAAGPIGNGMTGSVADSALELLLERMDFPEEIG